MKINFVARSTGRKALPCMFCEFPTQNRVREWETKQGRGHDTPISRLTALCCISRCELAYVGDSLHDLPPISEWRER